MTLASPLPSDAHPRLQEGGVSSVSPVQPVRRGGEGRRRKARSTALRLPEGISPLTPSLHIPYFLHRTSLGRDRDDDDDDDDDDNDGDGDDGGGDDDGRLGDPHS